MRLHAIVPHIGDCDRKRRRDPCSMMAEVTRIACSACGYELWSSWTHELDACSRCGAETLDTTTRHVPDKEPATRRTAAPVGTDA